MSTLTERQSDRHTHTPWLPFWVLFHILALSLAEALPREALAKGSRGQEPKPPANSRRNKLQVCPPPWGSGEDCGLVTDPEPELPAKLLTEPNPQKPCETLFSVSSH